MPNFYICIKLFVPHVAICFAFISFFNSWGVSGKAQDMATERTGGSFFQVLAYVLVYFLKGNGTLWCCSRVNAEFSLAVLVVSCFSKCREMWFDNFDDSSGRSALK